MVGDENNLKTATFIQTAKTKFLGTVDERDEDSIPDGLISHDSLRTSEYKSCHDK